MRFSVILCVLLAAADARPVDTLLDQLAAAQSEGEAQALAKKVDAAFVRMVPPAARLLVGRAGRSLSSGDPASAETDLDAALTLDPSPAAFHLRAEARLSLSDLSGALKDLREALAREPRFVPAIGTLSRVLEARGDWTGAADAQARLLALDPQAPEGRERLQNLRRRALGQAL